MDNYKFYRKDNYIVLSNDFTKETFYGFVKEVQVDKSNLNKPHYRFFNIKDFSNTLPLLITQLLKEDGSPYEQAEFEDFYRQNTGNFNGGSSTPGVESVTGSGVDNTDPQNPVITSIEEAPEDGIQYARQDGTWTEVTAGDVSIQDLMDNDIKTGTIDSGTSGMQFFEGSPGARTYSFYISDGGSNSSGFNMTQNTSSLYSGGGFNHIDVSANNLAVIGEANISGGDVGGLSIVEGIVNLTQTNPNSGTTSVKFTTPIVTTDLLFPAYTTPGSRTIATTSDTAITEIVTDTTFTITDPPPNLMLTYTTAVSNITTLPDPTLNAGTIIFFTNKLAGVVTLNSILGGNDIWDGGVLTNTYPVPSGTVTRLICDGLTYNVL